MHKSKKVNNSPGKFKQGVKHMSSIQSNEENPRHQTNKETITRRGFNS